MMNRLFSNFNIFKALSSEDLTNKADKQQVRNNCFNQTKTQGGFVTSFDGRVIPFRKVPFCLKYVGDAKD